MPGLPRSCPTPTFSTHLRKGDILLHHPFQSFKPVIDFIQQAATDPDVVAIKQTVYRTGTNSELMEALIKRRAARQGSHRRGRADGALRRRSQHQLGEQLEEAGAHVVYGVVGLKTHAKMALVVRREDGGLRRYVHLGTGNYHPRTARCIPTSACSPATRK